MCRFLRWRARYRQQAKHQKASQKRKRPQINQARLGSSHLCMSSGSDNQTTFHPKAPPVANH